MKRKQWLTALIFASVAASQAQAAELAGITTGAITDYMPTLKTRLVQSVSYNGYAKIKDINKKHDGNYGKWESLLESQAGASWAKKGAEDCKQYRYYAIANFQRDFMVVDKGVFVQISADIVCGD